MRYLTIMIILSLFSCKSTHELPTVDKVDLPRYMGTWYEIARLPNSFEKGLECITATYSLLDNGKVRVINRGKSSEGWSEAKGIAKVPDERFPGRLKVSFFRPFYGPYWIISLDEADYSWVMVGSPSRKYFWILARNPQMDEELYQSLVKKAMELGYDTTQLIKPLQNCTQQ
jgi:apolipoprotein D and lipocalin family protein